jgi:WD40 repeat protein/predicted Ser/Thr protein kinase
MSQDGRLIELVAEYWQRIQAGTSCTPEELCADCPELLEPFRQALSDPRPAEQRPGQGVDRPTIPSVASVAQDEAEQERARRLSRGLSRIADYEVLAELGRGGMGVVYKARQPGLGRLVALKMILAGIHAGPRDLERFRREAQTLAQLKHPHIVPIYEVGEWEGRPFFSLELLEGGSLKDLLDGTPWDPAEAARCIEVLARAMHAAHQQGIVHRDLKPGNILRAADGSLKISDFGLAKRLDEEGISATGDVMGTPSYMAPEQAAGRVKEVGPLSDVWALGAILYELLTGRPPFREHTSAETIRQLLDREPVPVRQLSPSCPVDLETICLKCLSKEPQRRYASAQALGEDLERFLAGRPVLARPVSALERGWRWCRRNPALATLGTAVVLAVLSGTIISVIFGVKAGQRAEESENRRIETVGLNEKLVGQTNRANKLAETERDLRTKVQDELLENQWLGYRGQNELVWQDLRTGNPQRARERLDACRWDFCDWEHRLFEHLCDPSLWTARTQTQPVLALAFAADGKRLAEVTGEDTLPGPGLKEPSGSLRVCDTGDGKAILAADAPGGRLLGLAWAGDGRSVLTAGLDRHVRRWSVDKGEPEDLFACPGPIQKALFSPDAKSVLIQLGDPGRTVDPRVEHQLLVLDGATGAVVCGVLPGKEVCLTAALSPDGRFLAVGLPGRISPMGSVVVWETASGEEIARWAGRPSDPLSLGFSGDGRWLASGWSDGGLKVWDVQAQREVHTWIGHPQRVAALAVSPEGKRFATSSAPIFGAGEIKVWEMETGKEICTLAGHTQPVLSLAFSRDGQRLASGGKDGTVKCWDAFGGTFRTRPVEVPGQALTCLALASSGRWLVSGYYPRPPPLPPVKPMPVSGTLALWRVRGTVLEQGQKTDVPWVVTCAGLSPDDTVVATGMASPSAPRKEGEIRTWALTKDGTLEPAATLRLPGPPKYVAVAPGGAWIAVTTVDTEKEQFNPSSRVWLWRQGETTARELTEPRDWVGCLAFSPDGRRLVGGIGLHGSYPTGSSYGGKLWFWDCDTNGPARSVRIGRASIDSLLFAPDGRRLYVGCGDGNLHVLDGETGEVLLTRATHLASVAGLTVRHDGKRLATSGGGEVKLWALPECRETAGFTPGPKRLWEAAFDPDDRCLLSLGSSSALPFVGSELTICDPGLAPNVRRCKVEAHLHAAACLPERDQIVGLCLDGTIRTHSLRTGQETQRWGNTSRSIVNGTFSPDGKLLAAFTRDLDTPDPRTSQNERIRVWESNSGSEVYSCPGPRAFTAPLAFTPAGNLLAISEGENLTKPGKVRVVELPDGKERALIPIPLPAIALAFSPDGSRLLIGMQDGALRVWDLDESKETLVLAGHPDRVQEVAWSADGRWLLSVAGQAPAPNLKGLELSVWDAGTGKQRWTIRDPVLKHAAFDPSGRFVVLDGLNVRVCDVEQGNVVATLPASFARVEALTFDPKSGAVLVVADATLILWQWNTGR